MTCSITKRADRKHYGDLHEDAYHGGQGGPRVCAKQSDSYANSQLEEVTRSDERSRGRDAVFHPQETHEEICEPGVKVDLDDDGHGDEQDSDPTLGEVVGLEGKDEHQREQTG